MHRLVSSLGLGVAVNIHVAMFAVAVGSAGHLCCAAEQESSGRADDEAAADAFARAVVLCEKGDDGKAMESLSTALDASADCVQRALLEPVFNEGFRDRPEFRRAIRDAVVKHKVSRLTLASADEPGEWIEIEGRTVGRNGKPIAGAVIEVCGTDNAGLYHPTIEGDGTARLFGTLVSDEEGRFVFRTVRPGPYPGTRNARHFHISARAGNLRLAAPHYMVFDDDPLLHERQNAEQRGEALRIPMRDVNGEKRGTLELPMR